MSYEEKVDPVLRTDVPDETVQFEECYIVGSMANFN